MLRNKSIFQIGTLICLTSISICNLLIDLQLQPCIFCYFFEVAYLTTPSVSGLFSVDDRLVSECGAVAGMGNIDAV
jgi:hypothetical protein